MEQVGTDQPEHGGLDRLIAALLQHGTDHEEEADGQEQQTHGEFHRGVWFLAAELDPDGGHDRGERNDEEGVQGLEPGGRHFEAADHAVGILLCVQVHQTTGLLETGPEDDGEQTQHQDDLDAINFLLGQRGFLLLGTLHGGALGGRHAADVTEETLGHGGLYHQGEQHADTGADEGGLPAVGGGGGTTDHARQQGAQVDAHVEDGEGTVTTVVTFLIQVAHHGGDVRFEQTVTQDQQAKARVEEGVDHLREHGVGQGQGELTRGHEDGTDQDGTALTEEGIGQPAADDRGDVDQTGIDAVQLEGVGLGPAHAAVGGHVSQIEDEHGTHAVVGESLPEFGTKEQKEPFRVT